MVLKEARPHCGLDREQVDAVTRLDREHETLTRLAGITGVPAVHDRFSVWEHEYLAMQYMPGRPLGRWLATTYPLVRNAGDEEVTRYTARALALVDRIEAVVAEVHRRGVVFGDLHPHNVLVNEDDSVSLVDFELAFPADRRTRPALGAQGFRPPADRRGIEVDRYALAALRLWVFLPLTAVLELERGKLHQYLDFIRQRFDLPDGYCDPILREIGGTAEDAAVTEWDQAAPDWNLVRKSIIEAVLASATPERADRLFPGTSSSSPPAAPRLATARQASCTPWTPAAPAATRSTSSGSWTLCAAIRPRGQVFTTVRTGSPTSWRTSATTTSPPG